VGRTASQRRESSSCNSRRVPPAISPTLRSLDKRQIEGGKKVSEVCRDMGVSPQAVYRGKRRYGGLGLNEVRELRQLREVFGDSASDAWDSLRSAPQLEHPGMRVTLLARTPS